MGATRRKYSEAEFFLGKLDEHYYDDVSGMLAGRKEPNVFLYFLSAFLSAARSVTWVMRKEYAEVPGWEEWFQSQEPDEEEAKLLVLFNELRIRSEKIGPIQPGKMLRVEGGPDAPTKRDPRLPRFHVTITSADPDSSNQPVMAGEVIGWDWTIDELEGADLVAACRDYLQRLGALLARCEARFVIAPY